MKIVAWSGNLLLLSSFILVSWGIIHGERKIYNWMILAAVICLGYYQTSKGFYCMGSFSCISIAIGVKTLINLYRGKENKPPNIYWFNGGLLVFVATLAIITNATIQELFSWAGGTIFTSSYSLVASKKIDGEGIIFHTLYLIASVCFLIYVSTIADVAMIALEIMFITISLLGIYKAFRKGKEK